MRTLRSRVAVAVATVAVALTCLVATGQASTQAASERTERTTLEAEINGMIAKIAAAQRDWDNAFVNAASSQM